MYTDIEFFEDAIIDATTKVFAHFGIGENDWQHERIGPFDTRRIGKQTLRGTFDMVIEHVGCVVAYYLINRGEDRWIRVDVQATRYENGNMWLLCAGVPIHDNPLKIDWRRLELEFQRRTTEESFHR